MRDAIGKLHDADPNVPDRGRTFELRFPAPAEDVDENKHISNIAYVRWLQECARAHSEAVGWPAARYNAIGGFFGVRRHEIEYYRPAHAHDEIVMVTWFEAFRPASSTRVSTISLVKDGTLLAEAKTVWVWLSIEKGKPARLPKELQNAFR
jgi:acyl-CoA thioester hydrolase